MMIRRWAAALVVVGLLGASAAQAHDAERQAELIDELLRLNSEGIPERIVMKQIRAWCFRFELDGDDIVELHTLGVSDDVIEALIDTSFEELECEGDDYEYVWYRAAYSPWWCVPYAFGVYWWNPWPTYYVSNCYYYPYWYYPHHYYGSVYHGYYGWHGSDYYVAYNPRARVVAPAPDEKGSYRVVDNAPAVGVRAGSHASTQPPVRTRGTVVAPRQREAGHVDVPRSPTVAVASGASAAPATSPRAQSTPARRTPATRVQSPGTIEAQPVAQPRRSAQRTPTTQPAGQSQPRRAAERAAPVQPAKRVESGVARPVTRPTVHRSSPTTPSKYTTPARASRAAASRPVRLTPQSRAASASRVRSSGSESKAPAVSTSRPARSTRQVSPPAPSKSKVSRPARSSGNRSTVSRTPTAPRSRAGVSRPRGSGSRSPAPSGRVSSGSRGTRSGRGR